MSRPRKLTDEERKQRNKEYMKRYYLKHKEKISEYKQDYYEKNKEKYDMRNKLNNAKPFETDGHSFVSPSSLERAMLCPASPSLCEGLPDEKSVYAEEGTAFHSLLEFNNVYFNGATQEDYIRSAKTLLKNNNFSDSVVTEMGEYWYNTALFVTNLKNDLKNSGYDITEYKELKLPMYYNNDDKGTLDLGLDCVNKNTKQHIIVILDYKYGKGVEVKVQDNPQLIAYAYSFIDYLKNTGALKDYLDIMCVTTIIYQPRIDIPAKKVIYSRDELKDKATNINTMVDMVYFINKAKQGELDEYAHASEDACRFCRAKAVCKTYNDQMLSLLTDLPQVRQEMSLSHPDIIKVLEFEKNILPKINEYIRVIKSELESRLLAGEKIQGIHLVAGQSRTQYISDTNKVIEVLKENGVNAVDPTPKLRTIGDIKKELSNIGIDKEKQESILSNITCKSEAKLKVELFDDVKLVDDLS